jgi:hypothetical protein
MRIRIVGFAVVVMVSLWASSPSWAHQPAPSSFTLVAAGRVGQGVTVKTVLKQRRRIGLVVIRRRHHTEVGDVPLGTFSGRQSIHWNLKVDGARLSSGSYTVELRVFAHGEPTSIPGPPPERLVISGQHVRVS